MKKLFLTLSLISIASLNAMQLEVPGSSVPSLSSSTQVKDIESQLPQEDISFWQRLHQSSRRLIQSPHFGPAVVATVAAASNILGGVVIETYCHSNECSVPFANFGTVCFGATPFASAAIYNWRLASEYSRKFTVDQNKEDIRYLQTQQAEILNQLQAKNDELREIQNVLAAVKQRVDLQ